MTVYIMDIIYIIDLARLQNCFSFAMYQLSQCLTKSANSISLHGNVILQSTWTSFSTLYCPFFNALNSLTNLSKIFQNMIFSLPDKRFMYNINLFAP